MKARDHIRWSETLKEAVVRCCSTDSIRENLHKPWLADGRLYATNGHVLAYLPAGFLETDTGAKGPDATTLTDSAFATVDHFEAVPVDAMRGVLEGLEMVKDPERTRCKECSGTGEVECFECGHVHDCDECDGVGEIGPDTPGRIHYEEYPFVHLFGWYLSPEVLERMVDLALVSGAESVEIGIPPEPMPNRAMTFRIGKLNGLLMPVMFQGNPGSDVAPIPGFFDFPKKVPVA